eukprot:365498-Chlamydomonas_euryale.AAC.7
MAALPMQTLVQPNTVKPFTLPFTDSACGTPIGQAPCRWPNLEVAATGKLAYCGKPLAGLILFPQRPPCRLDASARLLSAKSSRTEPARAR